MKKPGTLMAFAIIAAVLIATGVAGFFFYQARKPQLISVSPTSKSGAEPPHVRGDAKAPVILEEFGDFECMPCFILWPALRNLEQDFGDKLAVVFRERPLPQHKQAPDAARAAEAAGLHGKFWEMHDVLYLQRAAWLRADQPRTVFAEFAKRFGLDASQFTADMDGAEVTKRLAADQERAASLGIDRTPAVFINGQRVQLQGDVENGLRADIEAALAAQR
jgi:protein-disulfide isomerase